MNVTPPDAKSDRTLFWDVTRQIIDGPLMVDEIISWVRKQKRRLMLFKVDFKKSFDSLSWNFLLFIMEQMGFSSKWRNWILSCLNSSFALVLINGSLTMEFKLKRGLRQGEWSLSNANNLSRILTCFHLASGLKVYFNKSKSFGIEVSIMEVNSFASSIRCLASHLSGSYLGLPISAKILQSIYAKGLLLLVKDLMLLVQYKVSAVQIVSAASIVVNTVS
nr:hypothetical protein [Tanacetum cinerariifolium]